MEGITFQIYGLLMDQWQKSLRQSKTQISSQKSDLIYELKIIHLV